MDRRSPGFTLIELIIVIGIIAIVAAISIPNLLASKLNANETAAIATMRHIVSSQAQIAATARIDADRDGRGEYGTFLELSGAVGVRQGFVAGPPAASDFSRKGELLNPPILSSLFARVDANGFTTKAGYAFLLYLPDTASPAGFVHERFDAGTVDFAGGTGRVGIDNSEAVWCAYGQPLLYGNSGNRRFFTSHRGDILHSRNDVAKAGGVGAVIQPNAALVGSAITSPAAVGTQGGDGDTWRAAN